MFNFLFPCWSKIYEANIYIKKKNLALGILDLEKKGKRV